MKTSSTSSLWQRRAYADSSPLSATQIHLDSLSAGFIAGACDWRHLSAMTLGGLAYRITKTGALTLPSFLFNKFTAPLFGLSAEVCVYRKTLAFFHAGKTESPWFADFLQFGSIKIFGYLSQHQGLVLSHSLQNVGFISGQQLASAFGVLPRIQASFIEQWLRAETTLWQMKAGMSLAATIGGRPLLQWQESLNLRSKSLEASLNHPKIPSQQTSLANASFSEERSMAWKRQVPEFHFHDLKDFRARLEAQIARIDSKKKLLEIEFIHEGFDAGFRSALTEILELSTLQEIRVAFLNGDTLLLFKHLQFEGKSSSEAVEVLHVKHNEAGEAYAFEQDLREKMRLVGVWEPPFSLVKLRYGEEMKRLRRKKGLSQEELASQLSKISGEIHGGGLISAHETGTLHIMPLATLSYLAKIFGVDLRRLIFISNLNRFPEINPSEWMLETYPLYIESQADLDRLAYFRQHDPERKSLGFRVYAARKNPWRIMNMVEIAENMGTSSNLFARLEVNENYPALTTLQALGTVLNLPLNDLLRWANETYYPELVLKNLFGERGIHISNARERELILHYQAEPGSLGEAMFVFRKTHANFPTSEEMSRKLGRHDAFWSDREWNRFPLELRKAREWMDIFMQAEMPFDRLMEKLASLGMSQESPAYLLAKGMGKLNRQETADASGVGSGLLSFILTSQDANDLPKVQAESILKLQRALPEFRGDLFYRAIHPEIARFFPELNESGNLHLTSDEIEQASRFNLGKELYAHRMNHRLGQTGMAQQVGVSDSILLHYENTVCKIENPITLLKIAEILQVSPKMLYVYFNPEILLLFKLQDSQSAKAIPFDEKAFKNWQETHAAVRDPNNLRDELKTHLIGLGIADLKAFVEWSGWSPRQAEKYWVQKGLNADDILQLSQKIQGISYQKWFEHFYGPELEYFLGRNAEGAFNYRLPEKRTWKSLPHFDLLARIESAIPKHFNSPQEAAEASGVGFLGARDNLKRSIKGRAWRADTIARVSKSLKINPRLLYMYFNYEQLRPFLDSE